MNLCLILSLFSICVFGVVVEASSLANKFLMMFI